MHFKIVPSASLTECVNAGVRIGKCSAGKSPKGLTVCQLYLMKRVAAVISMLAHACISCTFDNLRYVLFMAMLSIIP